MSKLLPLTGDFTRIHGSSEPLESGAGEKIDAFECELHGNPAASGGRDNQTLENLFNSPAARAAGRWLAPRTLAALDSLDTLNRLIDVLLDAVISEPVADIATKRTPGDFSRRPIKTKRLHNLADYETFEDLMDLPTGGTVKREEGLAIEYFHELAARRGKEFIIDILRAEARTGLVAARSGVRAYSRCSSTIPLKLACLNSPCAVSPR